MRYIKIIVAVSIICLLLMLSTLLLPREERTNAMIVYEYDKWFFPYDYFEPLAHQMTIEYYQLYAGERLSWTEEQVTGILGTIVVQQQNVRIGLVCNFISIKVNHEWCNVGYVEWSDGERFFYIKYQTIKDGFHQLESSKIPKDNFWYTTYIQLENNNQWRARIMDLTVLVNFTNYPNEFYALTKSLHHTNSMRGYFNGLLWRAQDVTAWSPWGRVTIPGIDYASTVDVMEQAPYNVSVIRAYDIFRTSGSVAFGGGLLCKWCVY